MTRGHNIVANGWAGVSNSHPHPNPPATLKHTQKVSKTLVLPLFNLITKTSGWTNRGMDQQMDKASYRVTCPQLKKKGTHCFEEYYFKILFTFNLKIKK